MHLEKGGGLKLRLTGHGTGGWPEHSGGTTEGSQETAQTGLAGRGPGRCVCLSFRGPLRAPGDSFRPGVLGTTEPGRARREM